MQQRNEFLSRRAGCQLCFQIHYTVPQTWRIKGSNPLNRLFFTFALRSVTVVSFPRPKLKYWDFSTTPQGVSLDTSLFLFGNGTHCSWDTSNTERAPDLWKGLFPLAIFQDVFQAHFSKKANKETPSVASVLWERMRSDTVCLRHTTIIPCNMFANLLLLARDTVSADGFLVFRWIYCILAHSERPVKSDGLREHLFHQSRCVNKNYRKRKGEQLGQAAGADVWWTSFGVAHVLFLIPVIN